ncbi:MAG: hypothetical protein DCF15_10405 [Phormidesmis priestleyi]|uniref:Tyr recombinase domain-containing protein n=1 Tax=Phormidesmis priestleyi TaxID=268141 RepID=A0A2W4XH11_9CYAN|nr:MAG: hypothetical protein DCF15_10405 [Phormidesmis priestleyi]
MAKQKHRRNKKGSVSVDARAGMLRLRWRYLSAPKQLSLGLADTPLNRHRAQGMAAQIEADMVSGHYDSTLDKYRLIAKPQPVAAALPTAELFDQFTEKKRRDGTSELAINTKYKALRSNIARYGAGVVTADDAHELVAMLRTRQSQKVSNQNLVLLKAFGAWLKKQQYLEQNVFESVASLRCNHVNEQDRTPFTQKEVALMLETMKTHKVCYQYYDFTFILFALGLRPSEAIGLRWRHVDLERKQVTISESLGRADDGRSSGSSRQRKGTKTGNVRLLPLNPRLVALFAGRRSATAQLDDLVFTSATGKPICDRLYRERYWKRVCTEAGIPYRPPYTARHTFISHGIEYKRWSPHQAASMAGHRSTRMISEVYGHMMDRPELPDI